MLIQNTNDLKKFIRDMGTPPYVAIDTEFLSEKTYFAKLCLVQVAYKSLAAAIDPLSNLDLEPLITFFKNPKIIKVLHAAHQDLAIFWNNYSLSLTPIFDTQIAAMVCGFGDQVSYGQLVKTYTKSKLDKSSQIIDWSHRPLRDRHVEYALSDVLHLGPVYESLCKEIDKRDRASWVEEEMRELSDSTHYEFNPEIQFKKIKLKSETPRRLATLKELICWREEQANKRNLPRGWVLKDLTLSDIAMNPPQNLEDLSRIRGIGGTARGHFGQEILKCVQSSMNLPLSKCPPIESVIIEDQANESAMILLLALLKHVCKINHVAPKLVASKSDLQQIALGGTSRTVKGWRWQVFGELADKLMRGNIALSVANGEIKIVKTIN